jgi:undecaprenyl-diphosphatase
MATAGGAIGRGWASFRNWLGADLVVLVAALTAAVALLAFLVIANRVADAPPGAFDERVLRGLRNPNDLSEPVGPTWVHEAARDVTGLGGAPVLTLVTCAVLGYLIAGRHGSAAVLVFAATVGGGLLSFLLKDFYARPRPDLVPHLARVSSASFPSAHAMLSAVVYLTLGALLARLVSPWWAKGYFVGVAALLAMLIGASRVYLGVHYPTDVAAGWAVGVAWAILCWLVTRRLQNRGAVEQHAD